MSNKKNKLAVATAATGAAVSAVCALFGNVFVEKFLSKEGIKARATQKKVAAAEDPDNIVSEEIKAGENFYRTFKSKELFTFNKFSECLYAIYYEAETPSDVYVISCHGWTGTPDEHSLYAKRFYEMGYNVVLPHLRGHGKSEHKYSSMGYEDRLDIVEWAKYIANMNPKAKIVLHGVSMGAAAIMMATGEKLPDNVVCAIEDCGYTSAWDEFSVQLREMFNLPANPFLDIINGVSKIKAKFDFKKASPLDMIKKSVTPTLFIHGDRDDFVPFWMNYMLYEDANCEKERLVVPGAGHTESAVVDPETYWTTVSNFIKKYI